MFGLFIKAKTSLMSLVKNRKKNEIEHLNGKINCSKGDTLKIYQFRLNTLVLELDDMDKEERVDMQIFEINKDIEKHVLNFRKILLEQEISQLIRKNIDNKRIKNIKNKEVSKQIIALNEQLQKESLEEFFPEKKNTEHKSSLIKCPF